MEFRKSEGNNMVKSVRELDALWDYGLDEEYHDWNELLESYPNCTIWCVEVNRDTPFQYPPNGAKVYKWIKREFEGKVVPDSDVEKSRRMTGLDIPNIEKIHTDEKTFEERYAYVKNYRRVL